MERLTKTVNGVVTYIGTGNEFDTGMLPAELSSGQIRTVLDHLSAYEDTGLEPEEIKVHEAAKYNAGYYHGDEDRCRWIEKELGPIDRLRDLLQAENDGRLVVVPCKVGDTIWRIKCFADWPDIGKPYVEADAFLYRDIHYFGKTVFLTRKEAEAALAGKG